LNHFLGVMQRFSFVMAGGFLSARIQRSVRPSAIGQAPYGPVRTQPCPAVRLCESLGRTGGDPRPCPGFRFRPGFQTISVERIVRPFINFVYMHVFTRSFMTFRFPITDRVKESQAEFKCLTNFSCILPIVFSLSDRK